MNQGHAIKLIDGVVIAITPAHAPGRRRHCLLGFGEADLARRDLLGYAYDERITASDRIARTETSSLVHSLRMLAAGRVDAVREDEQVLAYTVKTRAPELAELIRPNGPPLSENGMRLAISRHRPNAAGIVGAFDQAVADLTQEGEVERLTRHFAGSPV